MSNETRHGLVTARGKIEIARGERPEVHTNDMLTRVLMAGVCGTDVHLVYSEQPFPWREKSYPFRLGHEWVGQIQEMGPSFPQADAWGQTLAAGDRIVAYPSTWACGRCYACRILLQPNLCLRPAFPRKLPPDGSAFADHFYVPEGSVVYRIPDGLATDVAVLTEPMAVAIRALERTYAPGTPDRFQGMGPGKSLAVLGSGTIGALITLLGHIAGFSPIIVVGGPEGRLSLCQGLGADLTIDIESTSREERVARILKATPHGLGADAVVEAAGAPTAFVDGIRMTRPGGTLVEVGHYTDHGTVELNPLEICKKDIQIFGCWGYGPQQFGEAVLLLEKHAEMAAKVVTHRFPLEDAQKAVETARDQLCMKALIHP